jgi:hypothetical protein
VILLQSGTDPSVEACRRGQPAIVGGQRGGGVRPVEQAQYPAERNRREARGAGSPVDKTQPLLGPQYQRRKLHGPQRFGTAHASTLRTRRAFADQHQSDVGHVREIPHRSGGRHLRYAIVRQQGQEPLDHHRPNAGKPKREIIDGGRDDGAHFDRAQRRPHAHGMAHQDVSRQLLLLGLGHHHVA